MDVQPRRTQRRHEPQQRKAKQRFVRPTHALSELVLPGRGRAGRSQRCGAPPCEQAERYRPQHCQTGVEAEVQEGIQAVADVKGDCCCECEDGEERDGEELCGLVESE